MPEVYIKAPWWFPPSDAEWIDLVGDNLVDSSLGLVTLTSFTLPVTCRGVIRWFGQDLSDNIGYQNITWRIQINNGPDKVYGTINGRLSTLLDLSRCLIRIPRGGNISFKAESNSLVPINCFGRLQGWYWNKLDQ